MARFLTSSIHLKLNFLFVKHRLYRRRAAKGAGLDDFSSGGAEGVAELPSLPLRHHITTLSLAAVALPKPHPSTACVDVSSVHPFPKARSSCSVLGLLLLWSRLAEQGRAELPVSPAPGPFPLCSVQGCTKGERGLLCRESQGLSLVACT